VVEEDIIMKRIVLRQEAEYEEKKRTERERRVEM
jgi:hypothetical protein